MGEKIKKNPEFFFKKIIVFNNFLKFSEVLKLACARKFFDMSKLTCQKIFSRRDSFKISKNSDVLISTRQEKTNSANSISEVAHMIEMTCQKFFSTVSDMVKCQKMPIEKKFNFL